MHTKVGKEKVVEIEFMVITWSCLEDGGGHQICALIYNTVKLSIYALAIVQSMRLLL
jgi:hypothetical protein